MDMWGGGKPLAFSLTANLVTEHTQIKSNSLIVNKHLGRIFLLIGKVKMKFKTKEQERESRTLVCFY